MQWNTELYDINYNFVSKFGEDVVALLNAQQGEHILDAGCGTGDLAAVISEKGATVTGIDSSAAMIKAATEKYPLLHFYNASVTEYVKKDYYDAIFSNAVLHWVQEKQKAAANFYSSLKPGGRLVLEMGGKGNIEGLTSAIRAVLLNHGLQERAERSIWYFPTIAAYSAILESCGFEVIYAVLFKRDTLLKDKENGIKEWLRMFGESYLDGLDERVIDSILEEVQQALKPTHFKNNKWYADYKRLRIIAIK